MILAILYRNVKWRFHNLFTIVITILQPILWLILYSTVANQTMKNAGIDNYTGFVLPGLIILVSFCVCSSSGIMNYIMKTNGSFYRILIAPVKRSSIILAQLLEAVFCTYLEVAIMCIIGTFLTVKITVGLYGILLIAIIIFLTTFFIAAMSYSISLILPNEIIYETVMNAIVLPVFFLSSALFPVAEIQGFLKIPILINPFTHVINLMREIILYAEFNTINIIAVVVGFIILDIFAFFIAYNSLKRQMIL